MGESIGVGIVGCGYVGLVTAACLAHLGHRVVCVDKDEGKLTRAEGEGHLRFVEPLWLLFDGSTALTGALHGVPQGGKLRYALRETW